MKIAECVTKGKEYDFTTDIYSRANLLTVEQSWNHIRGLSDSGKAALTVTRLFTARRSVCGEITVDVALPACVAEFDGITASPLSDLTHLAIYIRPHLASKLIALDCREAPMSKQLNSGCAKKCRMRFKSSHARSLP